MIQIGTSDSPRKYYIRKVYNGVTQKDQAYTRIEFGTKNPNSEEYSNWKLMVWSKVECQVGEYISLKGLANLKVTQYTSPKNGVTYVSGEITAHTNQVEIYKNQNDNVASVSEETILEGLPASASSNSNNFGDDLPF